MRWRGQFFYWRSRLCYTPGTRKRISTMKNLVSVIIAVGLAVGVTTSAFAATMKPPHTQAACEKAHMMWDAAAKKCSKGSM
jgi:hypothetical protein